MQTSSTRLGRRVGVAAGAALLVCGALTVGGPGARADGRDAGANTRARIPPDPPPLVERLQWVFDLRWDRGEPYLVAIDERDMGARRATPRVMGRFALELFEGHVLIERARFDFPMLGGGEPVDAGWKAPPRFEPKLRTRIGVLFPATTRGTRLELWDRATDRRWPLPWPPKADTYSNDGGTTAPRDASAG